MNPITIPEHQFDMHVTANTERLINLLKSGNLDLDTWFAELPNIVIALEELRRIQQEAGFP